MSVHEAIWLNETTVCSLEHLSETSGLSIEELSELIENGALVPTNNDATHYEFQMDYIVLVRKARRLRDDFELDIRGLAVALTLLKRIHALEARAGI